MLCRFLKSLTKLEKTGNRYFDELLTLLTTMFHTYEDNHQVLARQWYVKLFSFNCQFDQHYSFPDYMHLRHPQSSVGRQSVDSGLIFADMPLSVDWYTWVEWNSANYQTTVAWVSIKMMIECWLRIVNQMSIEMSMECGLRVDQGYQSSLDCGCLY